MSYNSTIDKRTAPIRGMVASGADLMTHMYDVKIWFPDFKNPGKLNEFQSYPLTVRATGFKPPEFTLKTYPISYHGLTIDRPAAALEGERSVELTFREDAVFELRNQFHTWMSVVGDPVTGGVSNQTFYYGKLSVGTIAAGYIANAVNTPNGTGKTSDGTDIEDTHGFLTSRGQNPIAQWTFYNVWVSKVSQPDFKTDGADANQMSVKFHFMDIDYPVFGGNNIYEASNQAQGIWGKHTWNSTISGSE